MSGITKAGTGMGMMMMPLVVGGLISAYSWRSTYVIMGVVTFVFVIVAAQFLRRDPGQMQQLPDGGGGANAGAVSLPEVGLSLREAIHTRQFWMTCFVFVGVFFCGMVVLVHIAPHAIDLGISTTNAAALISTVGGVSILGRLIIGSAGDRVGNKMAMIVCFVVLLVALLWLQWANQLWTLYAFAAMYGFAHGGFFAIISPVVASLFGTRSHGAILGIVIFSGTIGGSTGAVLAGHIFDVTQSYQIVFLILLALGIIGLILAASLTPILGKGGSR